jgi:peptidoglycan/LPS O-acetylase OafA/YrhL
LLVSNLARIAVIVVGVAVAVVAFAVWSEGNRNVLTDGVVVLGAIASALILAGAVATPGPTRTTVRRQSR